ncbi:MAG: hypothetical protein Q9166_005486 [cf. Caloplaca sp. 2 TL-2023]
MQLKAFLPFLATTFSLICTISCHAFNGHNSTEHQPFALQERNIISPPPSRHGTLAFSQNANVTRVLIQNPPINLLTTELISDLYEFLLWTQPEVKKTTPKVVIFSSSVPDFFISHFDLRNLEGESPENPNSLTQLVACGRLLQNITSTAFIAEIDGRTYGGGQELASQMDMRFAGPNALVAQYENSNGFVAQAGGQLSLGPIIGKARALEHLLASKSIDARTGTELGLFNNNYRDARTLHDEVDALAARIGLFPQSSLNDTKFSLRFLSPTPEQLDEQIERFAPIGGSGWIQGVLRETVGKSDEGGNSFERNIPNSVVQALYGEELAAMVDRGRGVLDAVRQEC